MVRPWDRLEKIVERHNGDIFAAVAADPTGADGSALACVRDVMNYMILVEAECRVNHGTLPHSQEGERALPPPFLELTGEMAIPETEGTLEVHGDASVMLTDLIPPPGTPEDGGHHERQHQNLEWLNPYILGWADLGPPQPWGAATSFALETAHELGYIRGESDATLTEAGLAYARTLVKPVEDAGEVTQDAEGAGEPPVAPVSPDDRVKALQERIAEAARSLGFDVDNGTFLPIDAGEKDIEFRVRISV